MGLREQLAEALKGAMRAGDAARVSTLRMMLARLKDADIAARPQGVDRVSDEAAMAALRGMVKSRREAIDLYRQGNRPDLVAKETAEIAVIEEFLPRPMDEAALAAAVEAAIGETGATAPREMGKVMAALKARHGAAFDLARAGPLVKARLGA